MKNISFLLKSEKEGHFIQPINHISRRTYFYLIYAIFFLQLLIFGNFLYSSAFQLLRFPCKDKKDNVKCCPFLCNLWNIINSCAMTSTCKLPMAAADPFLDWVFDSINDVAINCKIYEARLERNLSPRQMGKVLCLTTASNGAIFPQSKDSSQAFKTYLRLNLRLWQMKWEICYQAEDQIILQQLHRKCSLQMYLNKRTLDF